MKAILNYFEGKNCLEFAFFLMNDMKKYEYGVDLSSSAELRNVQANRKKINLAVPNKLKEFGGLKAFLSIHYDLPRSLPTAYYESYLECLNESESEEINVELLVNKLSDKGILKEVISITRRDELEELKNTLKSSNNHDALKKIYRVEKEIASNKAVVAGAICGVIDGLAVGGGLFAVGVALPILALIGIAVAAALVTGLVAGGITYTVLKPSEGPSKSLDNVDTKQEVCPESGVTA